MGIIGRHSFELCSKPRIISSASYVGDKEGKGPLRECFDKICRDDTLGLDSWEQAESRMFESAVRVALAKIKRQSDDLSCLLGGDLLNQIISSGFAAREIRAPFIGLYGACSTISEGLMLGGMLVDGGFAELAACAASSHFSAAERQFRYPYNEVIWEIPAGKRDKGEDFIETAKRELEEETGYRAEKLVKIFEIYPTPGYTDERIGLFKAEGLEKGKIHFDEDEDILSEWIPEEKVFEMIDNGEIKDGKSLIALLWYKAERLKNGA